MIRAFILAATPILAAEPVRFAGLEQTAIAAEVAAIHRAHPGLVRRLESISAGFLGTPYQLGPLGEGEQGEYDRDPLLDFRRVDCTTYVEQVMALALERDFEKAQETLKRIRYREGRVGYESRNHFPEIDWIPNNVRAGFLRDVTRKVAGRKTRWVFKTISKKAWYVSKSTVDLAGFSSEPAEAQLARVERWRTLGDGYRDENARLPYVALEDLAEFGPHIPSGTIANVVREDLPEKPIVVTHQGWVIQTADGPVFRHAAYGKQVEDVPLLDYADRFANAKWRVVGLNLNEVVGR